MKIEDLQLHLTSLAALLRSAKAKTIADDLDEFCQLLQPYADYKLRDFIGLIAKAEATLQAARDGAAAAGARPTRKPKKDPEAIAQTKARIIDLYHRAGDHSVTREEILAVLEDLTHLDLPAADLKEIATPLRVPTKLKKPIRTRS